MSTVVVLDTNIIIRFLIHDNPQQSMRIVSVIKQAKKKTSSIYVDETILAETIWVLSSVYKLDKVDIVEKLIAFLSDPIIVNPRKELMIKTLDIYAKENLSYVDCWINNLSLSLQAHLFTFDKKLASLSL